MRLKRQRPRTSVNVNGIQLVQALISLCICSVIGFQYYIHIKLQKQQSEPTTTKTTSHDTTKIRENDSSISSNNQHLMPLWIQEYVSWHQQVRAKYPGRALFEDPTAPNILLRTCLGLCGGLNDRLGQLPWDLYLANQTQRILLLHWHRPVPLEHFVQPPNSSSVLDWTVPQDIPGFFDLKNIRVSRNGMKVVRAYKELFEGYKEDAPTDDFWNVELDSALERAKTGEFKNVKVLRHRLLGHLNEDVLEERLTALGETDLIHNTPSFGSIFWMFFKPSKEVQQEIDKVYQDLSLQKEQYAAVHCRVRHPKATPKNMYVKGKSEAYPADKSGLPWKGETRNFAIETATKALRCAQTLLQTQTEPIYFFADSNDLVHYIAHDLKDDNFITNNRTLFQNETSADAQALQTTQTLNVVARNDVMYMENAHIDRQKGRDPDAYYATFVDLFLAVYARCVTYGIGYYAIFATKISGTQCKLLYQEEEWGVDKKNAKRQLAPQCVL